MVRRSSTPAIAQGKKDDETFSVHTSLLFDPKTGSFLKDRSITVNPSTGLITAFTQRTNPLPPIVHSPDIDLRHLPLIIPGLVDAHTHIFLHPYAEASSTIQMRDESPTERTIRAVNHCRIALLAGYTTYRDLGTEAVYDADIGVRNAINRGLTPGPRLLVATQAIASSGGYAIRGENPHTGLPPASDVADGVDGVRAAVRRRIGVGADVVKVYADYRRRVLRFPMPLTPGGPDSRFPPSGGSTNLDVELRSPSTCLWSQEELNAVVEEASRADCPVAAHCVSDAAAKMACKAGVTSIEHAYLVDESTLQAIKEAGCIYIPTLSINELYLKGESFAAMLRTVKRAYDLGITLACGGDTGAFAHGDNAREMELMLEAGIPIEQVLRAATVGGWKACGGDRAGRRFGWWEEGCAADMVGLEGDVRNNWKEGGLRKVEFVMKDGRVWKSHGKVVGMA